MKEIRCEAGERLRKEGAWWILKNHLTRMKTRRLQNLDQRVHSLPTASRTATTIHLFHQFKLLRHSRRRGPKSHRQCKTASSTGEQCCGMTREYRPSTIHARSWMEVADLTSTTPLRTPTTNQEDPVLRKSDFRERRGRRPDGCCVLNSQAG